MMGASIELEDGEDAGLLNRRQTAHLPPIVADRYRLQQSIVVHGTIVWWILFYLFALVGIAFIYEMHLKWVIINLISTFSVTFKEILHLKKTFYLYLRIFAIINKKFSITMAKSIIQYEYYAWHALF